MGIRCYESEIGNNNIIVGGDYTVSQNILSKEKILNIFENMCNYYYLKNLSTYKLRLHNFILENLPYYKWTPEQEQEFFIVLGDTSEFLDEQINYYKAAIDILPNSVDGKRLKWVYIKCKIIKFFRELFPVNN
ncbi:hypothetical protein HUW75_05065 [Fusobacterium polymorphum]|jgi:hypothetical protein|uniref:hypothetical protein n=1 Tax=Fusobacterium TaxID=848 RepID=UPI00205131F3|nr:MAG TPA: hypothetical protein [Caudoviricetes sp.]